MFFTAIAALTLLFCAVQGWSYQKSNTENPPMSYVLHLPKWYPHRYDVQDGDFVERHVAAVAAQGVAGAVLFATVARAPLARLVELDTDLSGPVPTWRYYYRAAPTGLPWLDKPLKLGLYCYCLLRGYGRVRAHFGGAAPGLVHVHVLLRSGLFAWWLKQTQGLPYVITEHWTGYLPGRAAGIGPLRRWLTAAVVRRAAALHTVSANLREALAALGARNARSVVIPNVVDTQLFHLPAPGERPAGPVLLHVAAFNEAAKNLTGLLRAVAALRPAVPGLRLRIAGYGPDEALVRATAAALGLLADGTVEFLGKLTHPQVAQQMRRAAAFVLFSNFENLPCVLIEAQASGLPAVATRVGGVPELLGEDGQFGRLVAAGDEAGLTEALRTVLTQPFDNQALRANAEAKYSVAAVGAGLVKLYKILPRK